MKNLLSIGKTLSKSKQQEITGGRELIQIDTRSCVDVCRAATAPKKCVRPHCIYFCDGRGGYVIA